ncbi:hypothetical protein GCM10007108_11850 [Thermogymnomonas acidicola]|uniref:DUF2175 domain-containing protein n=1 Tax=Thermogymnomonas acidicola TaxID=399579 RepID=A0AA37F9M2_9ARCH|nr:DUF2175 family protein [Thermogymnomonas acidicola]GGM75559.1 hypothetical protein GCM10007108_11850 [Thermogymnomonas acidicola]
MAEFKCYVCGKKVLTGEKFTFTKSGSVHYDCFISERRKQVSDDKQEQLRALSIILDIELQHLLNVLSIKVDDEKAQEIVKKKYKDIEAAAGDTTRQISAL